MGQGDGAEEKQHGFQGRALALRPLWEGEAGERLRACGSELEDVHARAYPRGRRLARLPELRSESASGA